MNKKRIKNNNPKKNTLIDSKDLERNVKEEIAKEFIEKNKKR